MRKGLVFFLVRSRNLKEYTHPAEPIVSGQTQVPQVTNDIQKMQRSTKTKPKNVNKRKIYIYICMYIDQKQLDSDS